MQLVFAVTLNRGAAWHKGLRLEDQVEWGAHARFMNALAEEGFVVLGGPLEEVSEVLLIIRAQSPEEIRQRLAPDPWHQMGLLAIARITPWTLRLASLPEPDRVSGRV